MLDTAFQLFVMQGVAAVPSADIARYAGVALRTIYLEYGSKRGLLEAIIEETDQQHRLELADPALEGKAWRDQLVQLAEHVVDRLARHELMRLCNIVMESNDAGLIMALEAPGPSKVKQVLTRPISQAAGTHRVRGLHSLHDLCNHFIDCMAGARLRSGIDRSDIQERAKCGLDLFLHVLLASCGNTSGEP